MEQDIVLMKGSIRDNIGLGLNKVDDQKLVQAANLAGLENLSKIILMDLMPMLDQEANFSQLANGRRWRWRMS